MRKTKTITAALALTFCTSSMAFMPAPGIWNVEAEMTGQPGRGFNIEVENEILFFTYYGYRADGSSLFYYAAGPMSNNSFAGDLMDFKGGTVIGTTYRPATLASTLGQVTLNFTSGTHGTITLPGESPKQISKSPFGYANGPDGLLGTWIFSETIISTFSIKKTLSVKLPATTYGNGLVATAAGDFGCEFQVSGSMAGTVMCVTVPVTSVSDNYVIKFNGDRGTGIDILNLSSSTPSAYPAHALRVNTKTGAQTGLNNATTSAVLIKAAMRPDAAPLAYDMTAARASEAGAHSGVQYDQSEADAFATWAIQAGTMLGKQ